MAADRDAEVDPRFDPVFQRGYDPDKHGGRRPRSVPRHATAETPVTPIREPIAAAPRGEASPAGHVPAVPPAADHPGADLGFASEKPPSSGAHDADLTLRGRNPFRLALLLTSVAAIGGAGLLIWNRIEENPFYQGFSGTDLPALFRSQLTEAALVPLLTAGLLGVCLWLAIGALDQRRRIDE